MDIPYLLEMKNTSMIKDLSLFPEGIILCRKVLVSNQSGKRDFSERYLNTLICGYFGGKQCPNAHAQVWLSKG